MSQLLTEPRVLIPEVKLKSRISELAQEINRDYRDKEILAVCVLKGSFVFFSDLIRQINLPMKCEFLGLSSYENQMQSSGEVKLTLDISTQLANKHVLIFEDIVDSGLTLQFLLTTLKNRRPASINVCSLLFKPESLKVQLDIRYVGFSIGNEFVVGFGTDYAEKFRGLPFIGYLENEH